MKILKEGTFNPTIVKECKICNTVLELDPLDITINSSLDSGGKIFTVCPICKKEIIFKVKQLPKLFHEQIIDNKIKGIKKQS